MRRFEIREVNALTSWDFVFKYMHVAYTPSHERVRGFIKKRDWYIGVGQCHVMTLYNNGSNLYVEPFDRPPTVRYKTPWFHVRFNEFRFGAILCTMHNRLFVQSHGHDTRGKAKVVLGGDGRKFHIPPRCVLYVSVHRGIVGESLLQYLPLPGKLCPWLSRF